MASPSAAAAGPAALTPRSLFGHPRGLSVLFSIEMWERFSYYGMRALLVLYMVKYLLQPGNADTVLGLAQVRHALEFLFGPLEVQPFASHLYGLYTSLVYLTPIFGGMFADRVLGPRRTVVLGAVLMAIGHFMMAFESLFLMALLTLVVANGAFKPNTAAQVGGLYAPGDTRRDRAFSILYLGINVGAFLAPLVCGTLGEEYGWHYGFTAAGVGMTLGLVVYLAGYRTLPPDPPRGQPRVPLTREERRAVYALLVLFVPVTLFWATYEQQGNTIALWADDFTDRSINLLFWQGEIPVTWFQAVNPFLIFAFTPIVVALWTRQARQGREASTVIKMAIGCLWVTLSYLVLVVAAWQIGAGKASWLWLFAYFFLLTIGELYLSPVSLSLVSKIAPGRILSMMMGIWLATSFTGNFLSGWLGSFWSSMDKANFFLLMAAITGVAGLAIWAFDRPLRPMLQE